MNANRSNGWREVINQWMQNSTIRRDILIGLTLVLLAVIAIIALLTTTVVAVAGIMVTAAAVWNGKRIIIRYQARQKLDR